MIIGWLFRHRRLYIGRRRIHHGRVGVVLAIAGIACMLDDILDWPWRCDDRA